MSRYEQLFANLDKQHQGAFVPFVTLGDPTPEVSVEVIKRLIDAGADRAAHGGVVAELSFTPSRNAAQLRSVARSVASSR